MTVKCKVCGMSFDIVHLLSEGNKCPECGNYHPRETTSRSENPGKKIHEECLTRDNKFYEEQIKQQKHEEIEKMAEKLYLYHGAKIRIELCWKSAEEFYDFAKEKEEEANDV